MDAAAKPPGTGLRRLPQPDPPRHPTECRLLTLIRRVQGRRPCRRTLPPHDPGDRFHQQLTSHRLAQEAANAGCFHLLLQVRIGPRRHRQ